MKRIVDKNLDSKCILKQAIGSVIAKHQCPGQEKCDECRAPSCPCPTKRKGTGVRFLRFRMKR